MSKIEQRFNPYISGDKVCECHTGGGMSDFTYGRGTTDEIPHKYCPRCRRHIYRGVEYNEHEWDVYVNTPNPNMI
jgi:hypothetical protein